MGIINKNMWVMLVRVLVAAALIAVSGCQNMASIDGHMSSMSVNGNVARMKLRSVPENFIGKLVYKPVKSCLYESEIKHFGSSETKLDKFRLSVKSVEKDFLAVMDSNNNGVSTALFTQNGKILDFNLVDDRDKGRNTSENYQKRISAKKEILDDKYKEGRIRFLNPISLFMPEFISSSTFRIGDKVASVASEDKAEWGQFVYRGKVIHEGRVAILLDLMRIQSGIGNVIVGFSVFDPNRMVPIIVTFDSGTQASQRLAGCE